MDKLTELFLRNKKSIDDLQTQMRDNRGKQAQSFTYSFVQSTLAEANASGVSEFSVRYITDAIRGATGAASGTGLPAFYDSNTSQWVDFTGVPITIT